MDTGAPLGPGDLPAVFECLKGSLSQNGAVQKQAEAALHALQTRAGFCSCLAVRPAPPARPPARRRRPATSPPPHSPLISPLVAQEIVSSREADHSARWLAAVDLKNCVNKFWRPSRLPG
jgi:hypothetical protein